MAGVVGGGVTRMRLHREGLTSLVREDEHGAELEAALVDGSGVLLGLRAHVNELRAAVGGRRVTTSLFQLLLHFCALEREFHSMG